MIDITPTTKECGQHPKDASAEPRLCNFTDGCEELVHLERMLRGALDPSEGGDVNERLLRKVLPTLQHATPRCEAHQPLEGKQAHVAAAHSTKHLAQFVHEQVAGAHDKLAGLKVKWPADTPRPELTARITL